MHFIVLFGPPAAGKMTVGMELEKATGIRLFHNHVAIEPVLRFFPFGSPPFRRLVQDFRTAIFREVAGSRLPGLCFTFVWDLDSDEDTGFVAATCRTFEEAGAEVALVELRASQQQRLLRNRSELRLREKPSKRDVAESERRLLAADDRHRMNSSGSLPLGYRHVSIDTTRLGPAETAEEIIRRLGILRAEAPGTADGRAPTRQNERQ